MQAWYEWAEKLAEYFEQKNNNDQAATIRNFIYNMQTITDEFTENNPMPGSLNLWQKIGICIAIAAVLAIK